MAALLTYQYTISTYQPDFPNSVLFGDGLLNWLGICQRCLALHTPTIHDVGILQIQHTAQLQQIHKCSPAEAVKQKLGVMSAHWHTPARVAIRCFPAKAKSDFSEATAGMSFILHSA